MDVRRGAVACLDMGVRVIGSFYPERAVGGDWRLAGPATVFPQKMLVDYVACTATQDLAGASLCPILSASQLFKLGHITLCRLPPGRSGPLFFEGFVP